VAPFTFFPFLALWALTCWMCAKENDLADSCNGCADACRPRRRTPATPAMPAAVELPPSTVAATANPAATNAGASPRRTRSVSDGTRRAGGDVAVDVGGGGSGGRPKTPTGAEQARLAAEAARRRAAEAAAAEGGANNGAAPDEPGPAPPATDGFKLCPVCTYRNAAARVRCEMCDTAL
jgi:hypothetical protein